MSSPEHVGGAIARFLQTVVAQELKVSGTEAEWRSVIGALPRCGACGMPAEATDGESALCLSCAWSRRGAALEQLEYGGLLTRIEDQLGGLP